MAQGNNGHPAGFSFDRDDYYFLLLLLAKQPQSTSKLPKLFKQRGFTGVADALILAFALRQDAPSNAADALANAVQAVEHLIQEMVAAKDLIVNAE